MLLASTSTNEWKLGRVSCNVYHMVDEGYACMVVQFCVNKLLYYYNIIWKLYVYNGHADTCLYRTAQWFSSGEPLVSVYT